MNRQLVIAILDTADTHGLCTGCANKEPVGGLFLDRQSSAHSAFFLGRFCEECLKALYRCLKEVL